MCSSLVFLIVMAASSESIQVNQKIRNSPIMSHIKSVKYTFAEIKPDFVIGQSACALLLSLKYHNQNPNYIYDRMQDVGKSCRLSVLVVIVDISDPNANLKELAKVCIMADYTLMVCWSFEEAAKIIELYKIDEKKNAASIMESKLANVNGVEDRHKCASEALGTIRSVNKTDALQLISNFDTLEKIATSDTDTLSMCPGLGPQKVERLYKAFRTPFIRKN